MAVDLGGVRAGGLVRYRCVEAPEEAHVRAATKLLKRVARSELLPAGKRAKAAVVASTPSPPSEEAGPAGALETEVRAPPQSSYSHRVNICNSQKDI